MRIWSIHPQYLDGKGLLGLWREALLAKKVLEGKTKGYKKHPQLDRFKKQRKPIDYINKYLLIVYKESVKRGYKFDRSKVGTNFTSTKLTVTDGQVDYEKTHLLGKLKVRDPERYEKLIVQTKFDPHPLFKVVEGNIEEWELISP